MVVFSMNAIKWRRVQGVSTYLVSTFEQWHKFYPGIMKFLEKCAARYSWYGSVRAEGVHRIGTSVVKIKAQVLRECNRLFSAFKSDGELPGTKIHLSEGRASNGQYGIFTRVRLRGMLQGKYYRSLDHIAICFCRYRSEYRIRDDSTYDDGLYATL